MKHSRSRVAALSDGVFAFAATLLVVDIGTSINLDQLGLQIPSFISFGVAFFVIMMLWKVHYNFFQRTNYVDNVIIAANTLLLFTILFYLFPLKTLVSSITEQKGLSKEGLAQLFILYGFGFMLIFISYSSLYLRAYKKDTDNENRMQLRFYASHFAIFAITGLLSLLLAYFQVGMGIGFPGFVYATLGVTCYVNAVIFRKRFPGVFN
ncbi:MAG: TMEM175 family protein [Bacteroidota bacterium]